MLINRFDVHPKRVLSYDLIDDQFLDRSCVIFPGSQGHRFPGSHAVKSHDTIEAERLHDGSHVRSCDKFPRSHGLEVTGL